MLERVFVLIIGLLASGVPAMAKHETGFLDRVVQVNGQSYRYQVFVPAMWDGHKKWPVILFLHGAGERGTDGLLQTRRMQRSSRFYPNVRKRSLGQTLTNRPSLWQRLKRS